MRKSITEILSLFPNNSTIIDAVIKTEDHIARQAEQNGKILVSVSGGSDSDIVVDMIEKIGYPSGLVVYVWFDTGLEYAATKRHLCDLEDKYGIIINHRRAEVTVPLAVKRYGVPFFAKFHSEMLERLQKAEFDFSQDRTFGDDLSLYPHSRAALRFWHSEWNGAGMFDISRNVGLKEFIAKNEPPKISAKCCDFAKKKIAKAAIKEFGITLNVIGVRKAEGGEKSVWKNLLHRCFAPSSFPTAVLDV